MSDKLMTLIDRYADLVYKSRTEPVSKYELREYDAIRCRMDIEEALSDARAQAFEEAAQLVERLDDADSAFPYIAAQIRQHSQKGKNE